MGSGTSGFITHAPPSVKMIWAVLHTASVEQINAA